MATADGLFDSIYSAIGGGITAVVSNRVNQLSGANNQPSNAAPVYAPQAGVGVPMWQWAAGGAALLLVGVLVMRRRG